ncbi:biotin transporter BioY [Terriglobus roseus]|uniref:Biotin transporter n=1 Tax=Terriglobus roseus TaxID=392734 RepID=A0A1H4TEV5_9BACT|nr:biotin transporter BioY [Terriglobus roseus]SEC54972.1 biotin transport system substrate-specific component [Terriglobus roseus]
MSRLTSSALRPAPFAVNGRSRSLDLLVRAAVVVAASLFVALCAHIAVPLPFTPVPFTLQPFAVILVGMLLGPGAGFAAMAVYLAEGAAGLPVFTPAGLPGIARLLGPTGGYLFAYPLAAAIAGAVPRMVKSPRFVAYALGGVAAMAVVYTCGALWFSHQLGMHFSAALGSTVLPFALSDVVKICAAAGIAAALVKRA